MLYVQYVVPQNSANYVILFIVPDKKNLSTIIKLLECFINTFLFLIMSRIFSHDFISERLLNFREIMMLRSLINLNIQNVN
jgi:hypothetical protein